MQEQIQHFCMSPQEKWQSQKRSHGERGQKRFGFLKKKKPLETQKKQILRGFKSRFWFCLTLSSAFNNRDISSFLSCKMASPHPKLSSISAQQHIHNDWPVFSHHLLPRLLARIQRLFWDSTLSEQHVELIIIWSVFYSCYTMDTVYISYDERAFDFPI